MTVPSNAAETLATIVSTAAVGPSRKHFVDSRKLPEEWHYYHIEGAGSEILKLSQVAVMETVSA